VGFLARENQPYGHPQAQLPSPNEQSTQCGAEDGLRPARATGYAPIDFTVTERWRIPQMAEVKNKVVLSVYASEYAFPPVKDMLVLGIHAPIGCIAMRRALALLIHASFEHIEIENDDVISDILVRKRLLKRVPKADLIDFVMKHVKPLLSPEEVLQVELNIKVFLSSNL
jgi:hypothetical protein